MKRNSSPSSTSTTLTKRKMLENGATGIPGDISDRLRLLSLPSGHLVEAVLKQHSHVFTADCRDRLRNLLQVIVSVNTGHRKKFERLNERLNFASIKNFQERLDDIQAEREKENQIKEVQTDLRRIYNYGPCTSSMVCNVSSSVVPDDSIIVEDTVSPQESVEMAVTTTEVTTESKSSSKPGEEEEEEDKTAKLHHDDDDDDDDDDEFYADKKIFAKDELYTAYAKTADAYRLEFINECVRTYTALGGAAAGDCDSDLEVLYERLSDEHPREYGDSLREQRKHTPKRLETKSKTYIKSPPPPSTHQSRRDSSPDSGKTKKTSSQIPRSVRARNLSAPQEAAKPVEAAQRRRRRQRSVPLQDAPLLSPIPERRSWQRGRRHHHHHHQHHQQQKQQQRRHPHAKKRVINVPSLAVRAYVALIMNMQRNCALYETFRNDMIKPVEYHKQPYITAAYECWMDYMMYVKNTLDYLHPYIMNLVHAYYTRDASDPELRDFTTKLPKVLINSLKDIKTWNDALQESIECCRRVFRVEPSHTNVHHLYTRHYDKLDKIGLHLQ